VPSHAKHLCVLYVNKSLQSINFKDTFKLVEEGYLKTNPKAKEYLELTGGTFKS